MLGDPDWRVLTEAKWNFADGVPVGLGIRMPRAPSVFRRKVKWRSYDETEATWDMKNYKSAREAEAVMEENFKEESQLGMMIKLPLKEAQRLYPDSLRIAAQGAIQKPSAPDEPPDHKVFPAHGQWQMIALPTSMRPNRFRRSQLCSARPG